MSTSEYDENDTDRPLWQRALFMLFFVIALGFAQTITTFIAIVQLIWAVFAREPNANLAEFGGTLAIWQADAVAFQTFASEELPFPWSSWPGSER